MRTITTADRQHYRQLTSGELREHFLLDHLLLPGAIELVYTDVDRAIVGGIVPVEAALELKGGPEMARGFFCDRREAGVLNLGATGHAMMGLSLAPIAGQLAGAVVDGEPTEIDISPMDPDRYA